MDVIAPARHRIYSIDVLRGLIMMIMALDHVRDFFHEAASIDSPTNLATTTPVLFFTRWITHFCAPNFVFLAGVSASIALGRRTGAEGSMFLIKRGLWLILAELAIVTLGWTFNPFYNIFILQVIWVTGVAMLVLGLFVRFPGIVTLVTGLVIVAFHNVLDFSDPARGAPVSFFYDAMHMGRFSFYTVFAGHQLVLVYAWLPWIGIIMLGYSIGGIFKAGVDPSRRFRFLITFGMLMIGLFITLRVLNGYGDPAPWSAQRSPVYTFLSFLNVTKYPPSLMYITMTIGPAMIALALLEKASGPVARVVSTYGRVPFVYYVLHLYLIHGLTLIMFFVSGYHMSDMTPKNSPFLFRPDTFGYSLPVVYGIWALVLLILYPVCRRYNHYKSHHKQWWLSYL